MSLPINLIILPFRNVHTHTLYVCLSRTLTLHSPTHPPHPPHTHGHSPASQGGSDLLSDHSSPSVPPLSAVLSGGSDQRDHHIGWLPPAPSQSTTHLRPDWAGNTASGCKGDGTKCECVGGWSVMVWSACSLGEWLLRLYTLNYSLYSCTGYPSLETCLGTSLPILHWGSRRRSVFLNFVLWIWFEIVSTCTHTSYLEPWEMPSQNNPSMLTKTKTIN